MLTLDEKTSYAAHAARTEEAEKHFFDANQPFFPLGFSIYYRNPGHWDVSAERCPGQTAAFNHVNSTGQSSFRDGGNERAFRIRGETGKVIVYDERWDPHRKHQDREPMRFRSVLGAVMWIAEELMQEPKEE